MLTRISAIRAKIIPAMVDVGHARKRRLIMNVWALRWITAWRGRRLRDLHLKRNG
jgi:hypothetical protein